MSRARLRPKFLPIHNPTHNPNQRQTLPPRGYLVAVKVNQTDLAELKRALVEDELQNPDPAGWTLGQGWGLRRYLVARDLESRAYGLSGDG